jgi:hypothetical protein
MNRTHAAPVVTVLLLAGCTATAPMQPYYSPTPPPTPGWSYSNDGDYYAHSYGAPPPVFRSPPVYQPPPQHSFSFIPRAEAAHRVQMQPAPLTPLREIDPPYSVPIDQHCGWWRLNNFWCER